MFRFHNKAIKRFFNSYGDVKKCRLVQRPALDEVEEGLLGLLDVHADQRLVVHGHVVSVHVHQDAGWQAMSNDL